VGAYDASRPLVIDPVLSYSTYLGGSFDDSASSIAVDAAGSAYVTGETNSTDFPTANSVDSAYGGGDSDTFVAKLNAEGTALVYATYLGGNTFSTGGAVSGGGGLGIAVDAYGDAYVTGFTNSTNFPTANPLQPAYGGGVSDAFVAKLNAAGSALVYATYLGGSVFDACHGIALDAAGNAYVTGITASTNFPTANALQPAYGGGRDNAFVAKLNAAGSALVYATYLGGSDGIGDNGTTGTGLAVDTAGNAYVTGSTLGSFPTTANALQPSYGEDKLKSNNGDAFVAKLNVAGSALVYATYLGGNGRDQGYGIALDAYGNAYVTGLTTSTNFPTAGPLQPTGGDDGFGTLDAFVAKLNAAGSALVYATYLGGKGADEGHAIALDGAGNAYVTGVTSSIDFPTADPLQPTGGDNGFGLTDAFVAKFNAAGSALVYATYLGGTRADIGNGLAVDAAGNAYVAGLTNSTDFPTANPLQPGNDTNGYGGDAFVAKIATLAAPTGNLRVTAKSISAVEGAIFSGVVANFTDSDHDPASSFAATIDWGDGTTSAGTITADAHGGFDVAASHIYPEAGVYPLTVTIGDTDGSTASSTDPVTAGAGAVTYHVSLDTRALDHTSGALAIQFNPGASAGGQAAIISVTNFTTTGGTLVGTPTESGDASGSLAGTVQLKNSAVLNEVIQSFTYGTSFSFDVAISGDAVEHPTNGLIGSAFAVQLLGVDGLTSQLTSDPSGAVLIVDANPDGGDTVTAVSADGSGGTFAARVTGNPVVATVADAPLTATGTTITTMAGDPFTGTVASFTDANPEGTSADFTATIDWGDGTTSSGTIDANDRGGFDVRADKRYNTPGAFTITIAIADVGGARASATSQVQVNPSSAAVLTVSGQAIPAPVALSPANTLTYSFTVTNTGTAPANAVRLSAPLPGTTTFVSGDHGASVAGGVVTLDLGTLVAGETATARFTVTPKAAGSADVDVLVTSANVPSAGAHVVAKVVSAAVIDPAPTVSGLVRTGVHMQPTKLVLTFATPLDPIRARKVGHYRIVTLGGPGRGGSRIGHVIGVRAAVYDPAALTVTLFPTERLDIHNRYRLLVKGTAPHGLTGMTGVPLDGKRDGSTGSDYEALISWRTLELRERPQAHPRIHADRSRPGGYSRFTAGITGHAVDSLPANGRFGTWLRRTWHGAVTTSTVTGGSGTDTLVDANIANTWALTGNHAGTVNGIPFRAIANLRGARAWMSSGSPGPAP
jgi:uncharacterized repeat protein (TIGR01451 family)